MRKLKCILAVIIVVILTSCATEKAAWRNAEKINTINAYNGYLMKYPNGGYQYLAAAGIEILKLEKAWSRANKLGTVEAYRHFIRTNPDSEYNEEAEQRIVQIQKRIALEKAKQIESEWQLAIKTNTAQAIESIMRKYPNSAHIAKASKYLEKLGKSAELDRIRAITKKEKVRLSKIRVNKDSPIVLIFSVQEVKEGSFIIYKDELGVYHKVIDRGKKEIYKNGLDLPLLKYTLPYEGVLYYVSCKDLLDKSIYKIFDRPVREFVKTVYKKNGYICSFIPALGIFHPRKFTKEEKKDGITCKNTILHCLTSVNEQLANLNSADKSLRIRAIKALSLFADPIAVKPLRQLMARESGVILDEAKSSLQYIERVMYFQAREAKTMQSYRKYIKYYPEKKKTKKVKKLIVRIEYNIAENKAWKKAMAGKGILAYSQYVEKFPKGKHIKKAKAKLGVMLWQRAKQEKTFKAYTEYLSLLPKGKHRKKARKEILKLYTLSNNELTKIEDALSTGNKWPRQIYVVQKLIFTGANLLNDKASWINTPKGRKVYNILRRYRHNLQLLSEAMCKVVLMEIDRKRVLFLLVKLGVPDTQKPLNELLYEHGDKSMAEDYMNSGSRKLRMGGEEWARRNGYIVNSGPGSSRVGWGNF